jgi:acylphosphatase
MKRVHLIISGFVQGVGYRSFAKYIARKKHLTGWVINRGDGSVEIVAEGKTTILNEFIQICRKGPDTGNVESVRIEWQQASGEFMDFNVLY